MTNGYSNLKPNILLQTGTVFSAAMAASGAVPLASVTLAELPDKPFTLRLAVECRCGENLVFAYPQAVFPAFDAHLCGNKAKNTATIRFSAADFEIGYAYLNAVRTLSEAHITVRAEIDAALVTAQANIQLLPGDEWLGIETHPESLAAFICPESRAIADLTQGLAVCEPFSSLAEHTEALGKIIQKIRAASMICAARDSYSPERRQRVKSHAALCLPNAVAATPMELALLFCACAERSGFWPMVVFATNLSGAVSLFCGARAPRVTSGTGMLSESLSKARSMLENGEMLLFDPAVLSSAQSIDLSLAAEEARGYFAKAGTRLLLAFDVAEARENGVRPVYTDAEIISVEEDKPKKSAREMLASIYNGLSESRIFKVLSGEFGGYDVLPLIGFAPENIEPDKRNAVGPMEISEKPSRFAPLADDFAAFALKDEKTSAYNKAELEELRRAYEAFCGRVAEKKYIVSGLYEKSFHERASRMTFGQTPGFSCFAIAGFLRLREKASGLAHYLPLAFVRVSMGRNYAYEFVPEKDAPVINGLAVECVGAERSMAETLNNASEVLAFFEKAAASVQTKEYSEIRVIRETALIKADLSDGILWNHIGLYARTMLKNKHFTDFLVAPSEESEENERKVRTPLPPLVRPASEPVRRALAESRNVLVSGGQTMETENLLVNAAATTLAQGKTMFVLSPNAEFLNFAVRCLEEAGLGETVLNLYACSSTEEVTQAVKARLEELSALERTSAAPQAQNELDEVIARLNGYAERLVKTDMSFGVSPLELVESFDNAYNAAEFSQLLPVEKAAVESLNGEKLDALFDMAERLVRCARKTLSEVSLSDTSPLSAHPLAALAPEKTPDDAMLHESYELIARILPLLTEYRETFFEISPMIGVSVADIRDVSGLLALNELYRLFISAREYDIPVGFAESGLSAFADEESRRSHAKKRMENIEYQLRFFSPEIFEDVESLLVGYQSDENDQTNFIRKFLVKKNHKDVLLQYVSPENRAEFAKHPVSDIYKLLDEYRAEKAAAGHLEAPEEDNAASLAFLVNELRSVLMRLYPEAQADNRLSDARLGRLFGFIERLGNDAALSKKLTFARARFAQVYSENECMLTKLASLLGADFRTLSFETGILNYDGLSAYLKHIEENLPALPDWVAYLEEERADKPYLAAFCTYLRKTGVKPGTDRLFASSLLLPAAEYMIRARGLDTDRKAIERAKEKYPVLVEKNAAYILDTALQTHRQRVKHYDETEGIIAVLENDKEKEKSVCAFAARHMKHLLGVFPIIVLNTENVGGIAHGKCLADTALCDDSSHTSLSLDALSAAKHVILLTHIKRFSPTAKVLAKSGALRLAVPGEYLTKRSLQNLSLSVVMVNGTMRIGTDLANPAEAELCVAKAIEMAQNGNRTAIFAFSHGQCAYIRHLLCVTAENDKNARSFIEAGLVVVRDAFEPCYESYACAVFSFAAAADTEGNLCRAFCMGSTWEFRQALYTALTCVTEQAVLVSSLSAKELDLFGKRQTAARELYDALRFASLGVRPMEASELREISVLDKTLLDEFADFVPARGYLACGADVVSSDGKSAVLYDVSGETDLFERLDTAERLQKAGVSVTLASPLDPIFAVLSEKQEV